MPQRSKGRLPKGVSKKVKSKPVKIIKFIPDNPTTESPASIKSRLATREGEEYTQFKAREDIRILNTQRHNIAHVTVHTDILRLPDGSYDKGITVYYFFNENPFLNKVELVGVDIGSEKDIKKELETLKEGFDNTDIIGQDIKRIKKYYREKKSCYFTEVKYEIKRVPTKTGVKRILVFKIYEGPKTTVRSITFKGLELLCPPKDDTFFDPPSHWWNLWYSIAFWIKDSQTKERPLRHVLKGDSDYNPAELSRDCSRLEDLLRGHGWLDAHVYLSDVKFSDSAILRIINNEWVVLDKTYFYPESGGQKSDIGFIGNAPVLNVQKIGNVVIHKVLGSVKEGEYITCRVNKYRRDILKKHHTATHIINTACREILGQHVWQHGAEKTAEKARLDITHYDTLTEKQVQDIENRANQIVEKKIPIKIEILERGDAEKKYGFRIYQGGAVPEKKLRIVSIGNLDHEACCGLHCNNTSEVGFISIFKTKRIQDGIVRLEFASGEVALKQLKEKEKILKEVTKKLGVKEDDVPKKVQELFNTWKMLRKKK